MVNYIIIVLLVAVIVLVALSLINSGKKDDKESQDILREEFEKNRTLQRNEMSSQINTINDANLKGITILGNQIKERQDSSSTHLNETQQQMADSMIKSIDQMRNGIKDQLDTIYKRMESLETSNKESLEGIRGSVSNSMREMRDDNNKKLEEIRGTVDEKLQTTLEKRISESFKAVNDQLENVYKGLGEMQNLASDVGGLKKVLTGVKTRGILGEIQLGAILKEILAPEQYETNVETVPGSNKYVEYAVKLPGTDGCCTYLPIDSKFAADSYAQLLDAQESGDKSAIDSAFNTLRQVICNEAKDIKEKYIEVPYTTNFGIMFLPFEGLYAEVVSHGLIEELQKKYSINVAGPSTMAALLNSLQMGFRTLAIEKKSQEVWNVLGAVKTEFEKFEGGMKEMQKHLNKTNESLENLMGTRTRAINRKLRAVQTLDAIESEKLLELSNEDIEGNSEE